jgi:hypothetical protein
MSHTVYCTWCGIDRLFYVYWGATEIAHYQTRPSKATMLEALREYFQSINLIS